MSPAGVLTAAASASSAAATCAGLITRGDRSSSSTSPATSSTSPVPLTALTSPRESATTCHSGARTSSATTMARAVNCENVEGSTKTNACALYRDEPHCRGIDVV
jgi:hypothetical protein